MFTPELSTRALWTMHEKYGSKSYGKYGFVDAFNPKTNWIDTDIIGINAGIILLSAENMRSGNVWLWFMRNPEIPLAMQRVGLLKYKRHHTQRLMPKKLTLKNWKTIFSEMSTENIKEEARRLLERLPDSVTWDELMHEIYVRQTIEAGLSDSRDGKTVDVEKVRERFGLPT